MENDICQECKDGLYLENNQCKFPLRTEQLDCVLKGTIVSQYQKCQSCDEGFISYDYKNHNLCFTFDEDFKSYVNNVSNLP